MDCVKCPAARAAEIGRGKEARHTLRCGHEKAGTWKGRVLMNPRRQAPSAPYEAPAWCPRR